MGHHKIAKKRKFQQEVEELSIFAENQEYLCKALKCPVCLYWLRSPVKECKNGHVICETCIQKLASVNCAECRDPEGYSTQARRLETIMACLKTKCSYGCGIKLKIADIIVHEDICDRRPIRCPLDCDIECPYRDLETHMITQHGLKSAANGCYTTSYKLFQGLTGYVQRIAYYRLKFEEEIFILSELVLDCGISWIVRSMKEHPPPSIAAQITVKATDQVCCTRFVMLIAGRNEKLDGRHKAFTAAKSIIDWCKGSQVHTWNVSATFKYMTPARN